MTLKLLQLNIWQGAYLDALVDFVQKQDFDILTLQEVTGGSLSMGGLSSYPSKVLGLGSNPINPHFAGMDMFSEIKKRLGYDGEIAVSTNVTGDPSSYFGVAIFHKNNLYRVHTEKMLLGNYFEIPDPEYTEWQNVSYSALAAEFEFVGKKLTVVTAHFPWGPSALDEDYKIERTQILYDYVKQIPSHWILAGDFNVNPYTKTASRFIELGRDLAGEARVMNTLNERTHPARHLFPPGIPVDYVITHPEIQVDSFELVDTLDLSDHFALATTITI